MLCFVHGSGNSPGSANQGFLGILFLNRPFRKDSSMTGHAAVFLPGPTNQPEGIAVLAQL